MAGAEVAPRVRAELDALTFGHPVIADHSVHPIAETLGCAAAEREARATIEPVLRRELIVIVAAQAQSARGDAPADRDAGRHADHLIARIGLGLLLDSWRRSLGPGVRASDADD